MWSSRSPRRPLSMSYSRFDGARIASAAAATASSGKGARPRLVCNTVPVRLNTRRCDGSVSRASAAALAATISSVEAGVAGGAALGERLAHRIEHKRAAVTLDQHGGLGRAQHAIDGGQTRRGGRDRARSFAGRGKRRQARIRQAPRVERDQRASAALRSITTPIVAGAVAEPDQFVDAIGRPLGRDAGEQPAGGLRVDQQRRESRVGIGVLGSERRQGGSIAAVQRACRGRRRAAPSRRPAPGSPAGREAPRRPKRSASR